MCKSDATAQQTEVISDIVMKTEVPGPESKRLHQELEEIGGNGGAVTFFVDYAASDGCYLVDADGNRILDLFQQVASLPLGYNHASLVKAHADPRMVAYSISRPALGLMPPKEWAQMLQESFLKVAPKGLTRVQMMLCGSSANENAYKAAFFRFRANQRVQLGLGPMDFTDEENSSCMVNQEPGCPNNLSIMSFMGGFHGRTFAALATTHSKAVHKLDCPSFDWPVAPFPQLKYPLDANVEANTLEEERCLKEVRRIFQERQDAKRHVAGLIVEPVLSEGGDFHASGDFFKGLQKACAEFGAAFIVDEVQTGVGATGLMWAHESWGLEESPDIVSFSKKALIGGYYYKDEFQPPGGYRVFNTWMGDPAKVFLFKAVVDTILNDDLLAKVRDMSEPLLQILHRGAEKAPQFVTNVRGAGTLCAFDSESPALRDRLMVHLRNHGVLVGVNGVKSIRTRPPLIFGKAELDQFERVFMSALDTLSATS